MKRIFSFIGCQILAATVFNAFKRKKRSNVTFMASKKNQNMVELFALCLSLKLRFLSNFMSQFYQVQERINFSHLTKLHCQLKLFAIKSNFGADYVTRNMFYHHRVKKTIKIATIEANTFSFNELFPSFLIFKSFPTS